eukprot:TRINITY_DN73985_c0_g1_i2.p1 TRINITY_DN73985_c0_g1~~TRINITY_DN73985_c0_g1_i2.p1  ORF type:complete len:281 (-),score=60.43 TRINITY_DN73985_c0_g1_i2:115-870(-)
MLAVESEKLQATELLISHGASMARVDRSSRSALSRAFDVLLRAPAFGRAQSGMMNPNSTFDYWVHMCGLMVQKNADINCVDDQGDTLLSRTVKHRRKDMVHVALDLGATLDLAVPSLGNVSVLMQSVADKQKDICEVLVARGASVNLATEAGVTPLCCAIDTGDEEMCFYLLRSGACYNKCDPRTGEALLMKAAAQGMRRFYEVLLSQVGVPALSEDFCGEIVELVDKKRTRGGRAVAEQVKDEDGEYGEG